ncbi:MAG: DUF3108 domain-containing protein [Myxococcota bacterium]
MKRFALLLTLASTVALAEPSKIVSVFGPGEQTTYEVSYLGIVAGRAQLTVGWKMQQFGHEVWPLICLGETTQVGGIWPIRDRFISYWDPVERRTVGADFIVDENKYRKKERYTFDQPNKVATVKRHIEGKEPTERTFDIERETMDLASAGYSLRNRALVPGSVHELQIFTGVHHYTMHATVIGREKLSHPLGDLDVFRVTVNGEFNGKMETRGLITLFYTADERQLPIRAEAEFLFGKVRLDAVKYEPGRRYSGEE